MIARQSQLEEAKRSIFGVFRISRYGHEGPLLEETLQHIALSDPGSRGASLTLTPTEIWKAQKYLRPDVGNVVRGYCVLKGTTGSTSLFVLTENEVYAIPDRSFSGAGRVVKRLIPLWSDGSDNYLYAFTVNKFFRLHPIGGKLEHGETPSKALEREILEEIGYYRNYRVLPGYQFSRQVEYFQAASSVAAGDDINLILPIQEAGVWEEMYRLVNWEPVV